ncbi:MAG: BofC C-terminal domain-containing protein [Sporomusaceae bacterium]|nr:BofC C-terminal domain-containing protein [Sporomusaceae bacterium]
MLPFFQSPKRRFYFGLSLLIFSFILAFSLYIFPLWQREQQDLFFLQTVKQDGKIKVTENTEITQTIHYTKCGDEEVFRTTPTENLLGMNYEQIAKMYPNWTIEQFDSDKIMLSLTVDSYCREHANNMFIGLNGEYVAVFYGKPGDKAIVKETTKIAASSLMPQDVAELQQGIVVQTREELMRTLEGLQSR